MATSAAQSAEIPQTSLYVGDLHPKVTEATLYSKFAENGPVVSVRVCKDVGSRDSLGYGYVNFQDPKDAERAIENMNYDMLEGRPIRIMWSQRDPSLRKSGKGNVFIKNLEKSIEQKELYDTFTFFGNILSCKIATDESGNSKGYGFVHFDTEEAALKAIDKVNNMIIRERVVYVGKFIPNTERKPKGGRMKFNNCYIKNFGTDYDDDKLRKLFSEFGDIKSAVVMKDEHGKSKSFGFVCFHDPEHAEIAVRAMHNKDLDGRQLYVSRAQRKEERQEELRARAERQRQERQSKYDKGVNLYVKNLDDPIDDEKLKGAFSKYGLITSAKVMTDSTNRSKNFGFVCFSRPEDATRAVSEMNGAVVGTKPLYVAIAQRKEDRRAKLLAEHQQRLQHYRTAINHMMAPAPTHHAPNYFAPTAYAQQQRYFQQQVLSQPKWNRNANMPVGLPTAHHALGGATGNPRVASSITGHYQMPSTTGVSPAGHMQGHTQLNHVMAAAAAANVTAFRNQPQGSTGVARNMMQQGAAGVVGGSGFAPTMQMAAPPSAVVQMNAAQQQVAAQQAAQQQQQQQQQRSQLQPVMPGPRGPVQNNLIQHQQVAQMINPAGGMQQRPSMAAVAAGNVCTGAIRTTLAAAHLGQQARPMSGQQPGVGGQAAVRYNQSARNVMPNQGGGQVQHQHAAQAHQQQQAGVLTSMGGDHSQLTMSKLASLSDDAQKEMLGNRLFPMVQKYNNQLAGKLTGMLLQMDNTEVIHMLESKEALKAKLDEAIEVIRSRADVLPEQAALAAVSGADGASGDTKNAGTGGKIDSVGSGGGGSKSNKHAGNDSK